MAHTENAGGGQGGVAPEDLPHLRRCVELAAEAVDAGDFPFGSVLVAADGRVLAEDRNRENTMSDATRHPEFELVTRRRTRTPPRPAGRMPPARPPTREACGRRVRQFPSRGNSTLLRYLSRPSCRLSGCPQASARTDKLRGETLVRAHNADGECLQAGTRADKLREEVIVVAHRRPARSSGRKRRHGLR